MFCYECREDKIIVYFEHYGGVFLYDDTIGVRFSLREILNGKVIFSFRFGGLGI